MADDSACGGGDRTTGNTDFDVGPGGDRAPGRYLDDPVAGDADGAVASLNRVAWLALWEKAVAASAERVTATVNARLEEAAAESRYPRRRLRQFFEVSREHIAYAALKALADEGTLPAKTVADAAGKLGIDPERPDPATA